MEEEFAPLVLHNFISVPRVDWKDEELAGQFLRAGKPVIITGSDLVSYISETWTNEYLAQNFPSTCEMLVKRRVDDPLFLYLDPRRMVVPYEFSKQPSDVQYCSFTQFLSDFNDRSHKRWLYLQTELREQAGAQIISDYKRCNMDYLRLLLEATGKNTGQATTNVLFIGQKGTVTPCHYDENFNFFTQLRGRKRFILFSPSQFNCLYPYPYAHSADRQSQVNLYQPDLTRFPDYAQAVPEEAILNPNEILFIPDYYWHHVENAYEDTTSLSFWFQPKHTLSDLMLQPNRPLTLAADMLVFLRRNLEMYAMESKSPREYAELMKKLDEKSSLNFKQQAFKKSLLDFLKLFLSPEEIEPFLRSVYANRFKFLNLNYT